MLGCSALLAMITLAGGVDAWLLLACIGAGAVGGALVLPRLRAQFTRDVLVRAATATYAAAMAAAALGNSLPVLIAAMLITGAAWIAVLPSLHVSAQTSVPAWVCARALSVYLVIFAAAASELRRIRRRDGAISWGLFHDAAEPERYVESFVVESWVEHLRQHQRVTVADHEVTGRVRAFHLGPEPPRVSHLIAAEAG